jgi:hypothetical protein
MHNYTTPKPMPKKKAYRSKPYLKFIRSKVSLKSGLPGTENDPVIAAHQSFGKKGTGIKSPDTYTVPLLWSEHQQWEHQKGGKTFWGNQWEALPLRCLEYVTEFLTTD